MSSRNGKPFLLKGNICLSIFFWGNSIQQVEIKNGDIKVSLELTQILSKKLGKTVLSAEYQTTPLHGGTLGDVKLLTGRAKITDGSEEPFSIVWKIQKKWERPGDPDSWRREYDFYTSDTENIFNGNFHIPACYHAQSDNGKIQLWLEYIDGASGSDLSVEMLETAAESIGDLHGKLYTNPDLLKNITCLLDTEYMRRENDEWHTQTYSCDYLCSEECRIPEHLKKWVRENLWDNNKSLEYNYLRSAECNIPNQLKKMLTVIDDNREEIFKEIGTLPVTLCHRDFWIENIFYKNGIITAIDWDRVGWGYIGEDIASLIADDTETEKLNEYFYKLIPSYRKSLSGYMDIPKNINELIWKMILIKFGYRIVSDYMFAVSDDIREKSIYRLQKIYEMKEIV
ncbi:aminoglycoside phosphotransferase family protein [bacterium]|nr:aminoglycoside phosphotransferase family protein [bacterium]